jgi:hypothetical protein
VSWWENRADGVLPGKSSLSSRLNSTLTFYPLSQGAHVCGDVISGSSTASAVGGMSGLGSSSSSGSFGSSIPSFGRRRLSRRQLPEGVNIVAVVQMLVLSLSCLFSCCVDPCSCSGTGAILPSYRARGQFSSDSYSQVLMLTLPPFSATTSGLPRWPVSSSGPTRPLSRLWPTASSLTVIPATRSVHVSLFVSSRQANAPDETNASLLSSSFLLPPRQFYLR